VSDYRVAVARSAEKELHRLPPKDVTRILAGIEHLAMVPRPAGGDKQWRIRVGDYRIAYEIDDRTRAVDVTRIAHRREAYE
jgi:mRNA interferase RelE/StbE